MLKLIKWELSRSLVSFAVIFALICLSLILFSFELNNSISQDWFSLINYSLLGMCFWALFVLIVITIIKTFGKFLFGEMGHLLFCLPISLDKILLAKLFSCIILIGSSVVIVLNGLLLTVGVVENSISDTYLFLFDLIFSLTGGDSVWSWNLNVICQMVAILTFVMLVLSILNVLHCHTFKFIVGVAMFIGINVLYNFIRGLAISLFYKTINQFHLIEYVVDSVVALIFAVGAYFLTRYIIFRFLELE
ncbi:MAG: hypothetical protein J6B81_03840 [Spirochaetaceae bacterium]|nr:hypothetical protein [Spirochaetaceae bacterium]